MAETGKVFSNRAGHAGRIETFVVSRDENIYEAWPDVVLTPSGKLLCVFAECTHHCNRENTRIMLSISEDRGRTWSPKRPLAESTVSQGYYYNCARISAIGDGRLVVITDRIGMAKDEDNIGNSANILFISGDEGETWSEPVLTPAKGIVPDKVLVLDTGRWILSCHCKIDGYLTQRLWYSDDSGKSWSDPVICAKAAGLNMCEASILPIHSQPGTLVAFLRENSFQGYDCYKTISHDYGQTWSAPVNFPLPGCHRPVAGYLADGKIMITYRFLQGGRPEFGRMAQNFFGAVTDEESAVASSRNEAWTKIFPIDYDAFEVGDLGYSGWVQFDDGEIYVVNYILDGSPKAHIRGYSFMPGDFGF